MSLISILYPAFLFAAVLLYYALPQKIRTGWVLAVSLTFYAMQGGLSVVVLPAMILAGWLGGLWLNGEGKRKARLVLCVIAVLTPLLLVKYADFFVQSGARVLSRFGAEIRTPKISLTAPLGISFFTFQTVGYLIDVYRKRGAEKNLIRYAAFVSFFPVLTAGPIERKDTLLPQMQEEHRFDPQGVKKGLLTMLFGYFLKLVISDRLGVTVNRIFGAWETAYSPALIIGAVFFALQLYCDFAGCSLLALGAAETMGFRLIRNFETPYFSLSVAEFWRRWHISLSTWFRDYLYIPLDGNRKGRGRKYLNLMIVFLVSGLWHGAGLSFIVWGGLNGAYQVIGDLLKPLRKRVAGRLGINPDAKVNRLIRGLFTFALIDISWVFFRAPSFHSAVGYLLGMLTRWDLSCCFSGMRSQLGMSKRVCLVLAVSLVILLITSIFRYRKTDLREKILGMPIAIRWALIMAGIFFVLIFGMWGTSYDAASFIYAGF